MKRASIRPSRKPEAVHEAQSRAPFVFRDLVRQLQKLDAHLPKVARGGAR